MLIPQFCGQGKNSSLKIQRFILLLYWLLVCLMCHELILKTWLNRLRLLNKRARQWWFILQNYRLYAVIKIIGLTRQLIGYYNLLSIYINTISDRLITLNIIIRTGTFCVRHTHLPLKLYLILQLFLQLTNLFLMFGL